MKERSKFSSKIGFVFVAAGSSVGLGNLWRFPYLAAKYGGGSFLVVYLLLAVTFGFTLLVTETAIGRKTGKSCIVAYKDLDKRFAFNGYLTAIIPMLIFPYYTVINGWVLKYFVLFMNNDLASAASDGYFGSFISNAYEPLIWFLVCVLLIAFVILAGVENGIEKISKILMPLLLVLMMVVCGYICTRPGASEGMRYYLVPHFEHFSAKTVLAAMGQLFYSLSLAMGIMITYGSYLKKDSHLEDSITQIEIFDTLVAFLSGLMIIPCVFAFSNGDHSALTAGPSLMFITLPKAFVQMGPGRLIGAGFFLLVFFAAITSSIALMEAVASCFMDAFHVSRKKATLLTLAYAVPLGGVISLGYGPLSDVTIAGMQLLDFTDFLSNSILMPIVAIVTCIFVGYVLKPKVIIDEIEQDGHVFKRKKMFSFILRYIAPWLMLAVLLTSIAQAHGWIVL